MQEQTNPAYHEGCQEHRFCTQLCRLRVAAYNTGHPDSSQWATDFEQLLSVLLHPQVELRGTAEQMQKLKWLRNAAAVPMCRCPAAI